jgi:hypothetical protein
MTASYSDIILWAIFLFLGCIGCREPVFCLLNLAEFDDFASSGSRLSSLK